MVHGVVGTYSWLRASFCSSFQASGEEPSLFTGGLRPPCSKPGCAHGPSKHCMAQVSHLPSDGCVDLQHLGSQSGHFCPQNPNMKKVICTLEGGVSLLLCSDTFHNPFPASFLPDSSLLCHLGSLTAPCFCSLAPPQGCTLLWSAAGRCGGGAWPGPEGPKFWCQCWAWDGSVHLSDLHVILGRWAQGWQPNRAVSV